MSVYIQEGEEEENPEQVPTSPEAEKNIERLRTEDRAKVTLSASIRERVSTGIQFIYNNTTSEEMVATTESIADDLMRSIKSNDAIAIDISTLKTSDEYTFKHSVDVATISMIVAKQQELSPEEVREIGVCGLLHDIGKTKIPNAILNKPGKLDDDEFAIMRQHSTYSYNMIKDRPEFSPAVCLGVLQHHEKINGSGYPMGVSAEKICPYAKILSVADIYDALVTERPYKKAYSQRDAVEMIMSMTMELDITAMKSFLESMILYPVDSIVELSNGEQARVVKNIPHYILRPVVVGLTSGNRLQPWRRYQLCQYHHSLNNREQLSLFLFIVLPLHFQKAVPSPAETHRKYPHDHRYSASCWWTLQSHRYTLFHPVSVPYLPHNFRTDSQSLSLPR